MRVAVCKTACRHSRLEQYTVPIIRFNYSAVCVGVCDCTFLFFVSPFSLSLLIDLYVSFFSFLFVSLINYHWQGAVWCAWQHLLFGWLTMLSFSVVTLLSNETTKFRCQRTSHVEPSITSITVTGPVGERLQAGTEDAPVLDRPAPLRRFHDSGAWYKYPDLLT